MIVKHLEKPYELTILDALHLRISFSKKEETYYHNLLLGYEGELRLEQALQTGLSDSFYVLSDLRFEIGTTSFQMDSLLFTGEELILLDAKNFPGDYKLSDKRWFKLPNKEISNPLLQLKRNETLMRQLMEKLNRNLPVESYTVFTHPEFTLYQAPINQHFIFPTQISRFISSLNERLPANSSQLKLAQQLISLDIGAYPHPQIPKFHYDQLKKGQRCYECRGLSMKIEGRNAVCLQCHSNEQVHEAVLRNIREFQLLFPDEKVTTNIVYDWCGKEYSQKSIKRFMDKNFKAVGSHKWIHYVDYNNLTDTLKN
ncbi:nuclease-related domain-containing protein [Gracilibacillus kekensis]|uniref:Nuclease-related domain-containing protein n=1 Tax=Gracilibacillus kekensis TaxID=1027249 RepID=A0A1M7QK50_9BACI|nr:nuclease-related domain-containing protein [Gracilibacillus kekensis]SHN31622.1 Nuclease-related domain-containing protein [Gracilibacillus kekensis]